MKDRITHNGKDVEVARTNDRDEGSIYIIIEYEELSAVIRAVDLSGISAPRAGKAAVTTLNTAGLPFTIEITWDPYDGTFRANENYRAVVKLQAKAEYNFEGLAASGVKHNGNKVELAPASPSADTTSVTVTISFDSNGDDDGDSFTTKEEYENGTDPHVPSKKSITTFNITGPVTTAGVVNEAAKTITVTVNVMKNSTANITGFTLVSLASNLRNGV